MRTIGSRGRHSFNQEVAAMTKQEEAATAFERELAASDMPEEKKAAAKELVERLSRGERVGVVLKDLAVPLGLTDEHIMAAIIPSSKQGELH